jgi:hypothetical protein
MCVQQAWQVQLEVRECELFEKKILENFGQPGERCDGVIPYVTERYLRMRFLKASVMSLAATITLSMEGNYYIWKL